MHRRPFGRLCLILLVPFLSVLARAEAVNAPAAKSAPAYQQITVGASARLDDEWLFHPGDDPAWASPTLDDSTWTPYSNKNFLFELGFRNLSCGWYRKHFHLTTSTQNLALEVSDVYGTYEVFLNGVSIGGNGPNGGHNLDVNAHRIVLSSLRAYPIPNGLLPASGDVVLALRASYPPTGPVGKETAASLYRATVFAIVPANQTSTDLSYDVAHATFFFIVQEILTLVVLIVALGIFLAMPQRREYLTATCLLSLCSLLYFLDIVAALELSKVLLIIVDALVSLTYAALFEFVRTILQRPRTRLLILLQLAVALTGPGRYLAAAVPGFYLIGVFAFYVPLLTASTLLFILAIRAALRGNIDARFLLPALLVESFYRDVSFIRLALYLTHITHSVPYTLSFQFGSYSPSLNQIADDLFVLAILIFLVLRTVTIAQRNAAVSAELEAARSTQQLILSGSASETPGFRVQASFLPAAELGGDFYLTVLTPAGDLLALIGDVSGKGITAALRVAMILGVLRREVSVTTSPAAILTSLNDSLLHQASSGFTTACCLRLTPSGDFTFASAGHLPPYLAGNELPVPPALPLGLVPNLTFEEVTGILPPSAQLTLVTDGVPEAQSPARDLLGLDQTRQLSTQPAESIAAFARAFGQTDDITVLTIELTHA